MTTEAQTERKFHHRTVDGRTIEYKAYIIRREGPVIEGSTPSPRFRHSVRTDFIVHLAPGDSFVEVEEK